MASVNCLKNGRPQAREANEAAFIAGGSPSNSQFTREIVLGAWLGTLGVGGRGVSPGNNVNAKEGIIRITGRSYMAK